MMSEFRKHKGFSLIEAMVALLVIAVGLLGIAGMQALSVNSTATSRVRALASIEASNMAAYMGANSSYWRGALGVSVTVSPQAGGAVLTDATLNSLSVDCAGSTCTPQQMAAYDLKQWGSAQQLGLLPGGEGAVSCNAISGVCTVTVGWSQKEMATNTTGAALAPAVTYFRMVVQP